MKSSCRPTATVNLYTKKKEEEEEEKGKQNQQNLKRREMQPQLSQVPY